MELFKSSSRVPFMRQRKLAYAISALLFVVSIGSLLTRGLNLGIDFTGGVTVEAVFPQDADLNAIRSELNRAGFAEPQVQTFGSARDVAVRLPPPGEGQNASAIQASVERALAAVDAQAEVRRFEVVGPQVGEDLRNSAIWSLFFTLLLIGLYVFIRFHTWKLSLGAMISAIHDPIIVVGFFSIFWLPFDLSVVAAILAVIGYSLNDTVVVFDRIRERFEGNKRLASSEVLDQSVNQTLSRTIMTSMTTLIVVVVLLLIGGPVLQGFSTALIIGILVGTYSSIYVAAAVALDCGLKSEDIFPQIKNKAAIDNMP